MVLFSAQPCYEFSCSLQGSPQLSACLDAANCNTAKNHSLVNHGSLVAMVLISGIMLPDFVPSPEPGNSIFKCIKLVLLQSRILNDIILASCVVFYCSLQQSAM